MYKALAVLLLAATAPQFQTFTPEGLRDAIKVYSRRSFAAWGFNDSAVTVRVPAAPNSIYTQFDFEPPRLTDARGREVPYELERGIFDFDTNANEIRVQPKSGKSPVEFAHATGKVTVKYPLSIRTATYRKGSSKEVTIDGSTVAYTSQIELPKAAPFSKLQPLRAYDASGRELAQKDKSNDKFEFDGKVAEVRVDRVEKWATVAIDYDLPPVPKLPMDTPGLTPPLEEQLKVTSTPGAKVTKTLQ